MSEKVINYTDFEKLGKPRRGKVRDIYDLGDRLLIVATDRISAFDVVMPNPIPNKGKILTKLSLFWFTYTKRITINHLLPIDPESDPLCQIYADSLQDRSMMVKKVRVLPVEAVVRGYLSGSAWESYQNDGTVCDIKLPPGLKESEKLPGPIFTPSTKAEIGHDENISFAKLELSIGSDLAAKIKDCSIQLYQFAAAYAESRGIIIADTKLEFGLENGHLILIDELFTPDSSRFWPKDKYQPGGPQPSFDKQYLRDWLKSIGWDKKPPAPELPQDVIEQTEANYQKAQKLLLGK